MKNGLWTRLTWATSGIIGFIVVKLLLDSLDTSEWSGGLKAFAGMIPIISGVCAVLAVIVGITGGVVVTRYLKWRAFGNRLKVAYEAKFGYSNPAFNEEVDQHIQVMEAMGKGSTKGIAEDWLKRIAKFVEVPFAIPEEESLSEEEKTDLFDKYVRKPDGVSS